MTFALVIGDLALKTGLAFPFAYINRLEFFPGLTHILIQICKQIIQESELRTLRAEVMSLEKLSSHYQERFNIIGSVHKVFLEETPHGKKYKYLHIEQMLLDFHYSPMQFMDWLLEQYCYMQFSKVIPEYIEYLQKIGLDTCFDSFSHELCRRFYTK